MVDALTQKPWLQFNTGTDSSTALRTCLIGSRDVMDLHSSSTAMSTRLEWVRAMDRIVRLLSWISSLLSLTKSIRKYCKISDHTSRLRMVAMREVGVVTVVIVVTMQSLVTEATPNYGTTERNVSMIPRALFHTHGCFVKQPPSCAGC